jgi:hypothetical protein
VAAEVLAEADLEEHDGQVLAFEGVDDWRRVGRYSSDVYDVGGRCYCYRNTVRNSRSYGVKTCKP